MHWAESEKYLEGKLPEIMYRVASYPGTRLCTELNRVGLNFLELCPILYNPVPQI